MEGFRTKSTIQTLALLALIFASTAIPAHAQDVELPRSDEPTAELTGDALDAHLSLQLDQLDSAEFRTRELAAWRMQQYPEAAIELIAKSAPNASINSAAQQIVILDSFLSHPSTVIKTYAYDTLKGFSLTRNTALASLAASSVKGIEDDFERKAYEILTHAGADIGHLDININGSKPLFKSDLGIEIKPGKFTGDAETLSWMRYLKSVPIVSLEGQFASPEALALVAQMAGVKKILLRGKYVRPGFYSTNLKPNDLLVLKGLPEIQHLEIKYMSVDDSFVPAICQLPITESLRLFGTAISEQGKFELAQQLDGLEIYRGGGGFLGIGSAQLGPVQVNQVTENSAAENAGIQEGDIILEIQGAPIKNFAGLRATLANHAPNEMLLVKLRRPNPAFGMWRLRQNREGTKPIEYFEQQVFVVLNEQPN